MMVKKLRRNTRYRARFFDVKTKAYKMFYYGTIPKEELLFVGEDLDGHVGKSNKDYEDCDGGLGYGIRNSPGEDILSMCKSNGLIVLNTIFIKQNWYLVTYSSGRNETQIDYHLVSRFMKFRIKDDRPATPPPPDRNTYGGGNEQK